MLGLVSTLTLKQRSFKKDRPRPRVLLTPVGKTGSNEFLLVESGILGFGIRNSALGIENQSSTYKDSGIQ